MAQAILQAAIGAAMAGIKWIGLNGNRTMLADQTATSSTITFIAPVRAVRGMVWCKSFTAGSGTVGPIWEIQVADNSGFSTNVRTIAIAQGPRAVHALRDLSGVVPDNSLAQWCKIKVTFSGTDTATFDAVIDAV